MIYVRPTYARDGAMYHVAHDPAEGRRDHVLKGGELVPESQWYLLALREGRLERFEPVAEPVAEPEPVVEPAPKPAKKAAKKGTK